MITVNIYGEERSSTPFDNNFWQEKKFESEVELQAFLEGLRLGIKINDVTIKEVEGQREWKF